MFADMQMLHHIKKKLLLNCCTKNEMIFSIKILELPPFSMNNLNAQDEQNKTIIEKDKKAFAYSMD